MPFKSKAQAREMYAKQPEVAKEFSKKTKSIKALPEKVKAPKSKKPKKPSSPPGKKRGLQPIEDRRKM